MRSQGGQGFGHVMRVGIHFAHSVAEHGMSGPPPLIIENKRMDFLGTDHCPNVLLQQRSLSLMSIWT